MRTSYKTDRRRFVDVKHVENTNERAIEPCQRLARVQKRGKERSHRTEFFVSTVQAISQLRFEAEPMPSNPQSVCLSVCLSVLCLSTGRNSPLCCVLISPDFHMLGIIASFLFRVWQRTGYNLMLRHLTPEKRSKGVEK